MSLTEMAMKKYWPVAERLRLVFAEEKLYRVGIPNLLRVLPKSIATERLTKTERAKILSFCLESLGNRGLQARKSSGEEK